MPKGNCISCKSILDVSDDIVECSICGAIMRVVDWNPFLLELVTPQAVEVERVEPRIEPDLDDLGYPSQPLSLQSESIGNFLLAFLWIELAFSVSSLFFTLLALVAPDVYTVVVLFDFINYFSQPLVILITSIMFLVWMYRLHSDLKTLFRTYPITPGQSLAQIMIPFYNLWGIWNVFATLADRLRARGGEALRVWLPALYLTSCMSRILNRFVLSESSNGDSQASPFIVVFTLGVDLFLSIIWLEMARVIRKAVRNRVNEIEEQKASAVTPA